jgi:phospholipase/carboxylesterase
VPENQPELSSVRVWIGAGSTDPIVPASETKQLAELLRGAGADVTIRFFQGGHKLTQADIHAAQEWLRA